MTLPTPGLAPGLLLRGLNQLDIALQQIVDQPSKINAFSFGALGEPVADVGVEVDGQIEHGVFAVELAAFGWLKSYSGFTLVAPLRVVFIGRK